MVQLPESEPVQSALAPCGREIINPNETCEEDFLSANNARGGDLYCRMCGESGVGISIEQSGEEIPTMVPAED